jgi:hypothetical protein
VGINQLTCEVKHFTAKADGTEEEHEWTECEKTGREYEAAVAALMAQQRTAAQAQGKGKLTLLWLQITQRATISATICRTTRNPRYP